MYSLHRLKCIVEIAHPSLTSHTTQICLDFPSLVWTVAEWFRHGPVIILISSSDIPALLITWLYQSESFLASNHFLFWWTTYHYSHSNLNTILRNQNKQLSPYIRTLTESFFLPTLNISYQPISPIYPPHFSSKCYLLHIILNSLLVCLEFKQWQNRQTTTYKMVSIQHFFLSLQLCGVYEWPLAMCYYQVSEWEI